MKRAASRGTWVTPEHLMCPITHSLMRWPAMAADGHVYEHLAIRRWLLDSTTSPMTGAKLRSALLVPVVPLRIICDAVVAELDADKLQELEDQVTFFSILCDRLLDRLCARIHACTRCAFTYEDPAGADAARQRWVLDMDGDSPEDVARMLVCTARDRCASRSVGFESTLAALERVACVSKKAVAQSGAVECAIAALQSEAGRPPPGVAEAALSVIARAGGGVDPRLAIASVLGELDRAGGLAALAAVLPGASADEMRGCVASVLGKLLDRIPDTAAAAMRPGSVLVAGLGDSPIAHQVRDAIAGAMKTHAADHNVQLAALRALREEAPRLKACGTAFYGLGTAIAEQLLRAQAMGSRAVKDEAYMLLRDIGLLESPRAPAPVIVPLPEYDDDYEDDGSDSEV